MPFHAPLRDLAFTAALVCLSLIGVQPAIAADHGLTVTNAWVRMMPPTIKVHGGYLTITNSGAQVQELVAAASDDYEAVEVHLSRIENGVATMQRLESIEIPAGGTVKFEPGGMHLMLMGARKPLEHGALVPIRLGFRAGTKIEVEAIVMNNPPDGSAAKMKDMDHSGHGGQPTH
jgi:copper(I)-binding protein